MAERSSRVAQCSHNFPSANRNQWVCKYSNLRPLGGRKPFNLLIWATGFTRADAIASLVVAALMVKAGWGLVRDSGRVFLEAAPRGTDPEQIGTDLADLPGVVEVHDLHLWEITSGEPVLSAHVLVDPDTDCHRISERARALLHEGHQLDHATCRSTTTPAASGRSTNWARTTAATPMVLPTAAPVILRPQRRFPTLGREPDVQLH